MATLSRTDGLFDVPDTDYPKEEPFNFNHTALLRDLSLVGLISFT